MERMKVEWHEIDEPGTGKFVSRDRDGLESESNHHKPGQDSKPDKLNTQES